MYKNISKQVSLKLKDLVDYQDGQVVSKTLVQNEHVSMTIFSFDQGEEISTHAAGGDAMVTVLDGTGRFTVGGEVFLLNEGGNTHHAEGYSPCGVRGDPVQNAAHSLVLTQRGGSNGSCPSV